MIPGALPARSAGAAPIARWVAAITGSLLTYAIGVAVAPSLPIDPHADFVSAAVAYLVAFVAVSVMTIVVGALVPAPGRLAMLAIGGVVLALVVLAIAPLPIGTRAGAIAGGALVLALLLAGGSLAGALVGTRIEHAGHLSVVAVASSLADLWSVLSPDGPSAAVAESAPLLAVVALSFPMIGTEAIEPLLGVGDVVFVALYLSASRRLELGVGRSSIALAIAFVATAMAVLAMQRALPALPFLGAAMLIAHPRARLPPPKDRKVAAIGLAVLAALASGVLLLRR